jgi:hypothetical protein
MGSVKLRQDEVAGFLDKIKYNSIELARGGHLRNRALDDVWANKKHPSFAGIAIMKDSDGSGERPVDVSRQPAHFHPTQADSR